MTQDDMVVCSSPSTFSYSGKGRELGLTGAGILPGECGEQGVGTERLYCWTLKSKPGRR